MGMSILISKKKLFVDSGHGIIRRDAFCFLLSQFSGKVWSSLSEEPQKNQGELLS